MRTIETIIENDPNDIGQHWPVKSFLGAYPDQNEISACAIMAMSENFENADKTAVLVLRTFIKNQTKAKEDQKFIIGIRFYNFGDIATIDLISLEDGFHKEICYEHLKRMNWPVLAKTMNQDIDYFDENTLAPFLIIGGHLIVKDDQLNFSGSSGDFGHNIFLGESNSIAEYVATTCGLNVNQNNESAGEKFIADILSIMHKHKTKKDFYQLMVKEIYELKGEKFPRLTSQQIGGLTMMKVLDRIENEGSTNLMQLMVEEIVDSTSIGKSVLINTVARKVRDQQ